MTYFGVKWCYVSFILAREWHSLYKLQVNGNDWAMVQVGTMAYEMGLRPFCLSVPLKLWHDKNCSVFKNLLTLVRKKVLYGTK